MSKIVKAINVMVSNPELITNATKGVHETECFFIYDKKHSWSILKAKDGHFGMSYYPGNQDIFMLSTIPDEHWSETEINSVLYTSRDLATKEAKDSMKELFNIVNEKLYGMDEVLDDIIRSDELPF